MVSGRKVAATYRSSYDSGGEGGCPPVGSSSSSMMVAAAAMGMGSSGMTPPFDIPTPSFALSNPGPDRIKQNSPAIKLSAQVCGCVCLSVFRCVCMCLSHCVSVFVSLFIFLCRSLSVSVTTVVRLRETIMT